MTAPAAPSELWQLVQAGNAAPTRWPIDVTSDRVSIAHAEAKSQASSEATIGARGSTLEALECILSGPSCPRGSEQARAASRRLLGHLERTRLPARHLWSLLDPAGRTVAAALAMPGPGRTAQILASRPRNDAELSATTRAIAAAADGLGPREASVAQALLDAVDPAVDPALGGDALGAARHRAAYLAAGFSTLATLDYLARPLPRRGDAPAPVLPAGATILPWRRGDAVLARVLDATYEGTLDCPGLCGLRRTEDILHGHLAGARYEAGLWFLLYLDGQAVGALLLSAGHGGDEIDLVYLGLASSARGRGLGRLLLAHGLHKIAGRRERRVVLAVDRANEPAVRVYDDAGFVRTASRLALIKALPASRHSA